MMLSDRDIHAARDDGRFDLTPWHPERVQPASVDVELGESLMVTHHDDRLAHTTIGSGYVMDPGDFLLATTAETIALGDDLAARVEGKSSLGRLGLAVHITAGFIDPGFRGQITLELANLSPQPILLRPGMLIAQLCFIPMSSPVDRPYGSPGLGSHYQGQQGATESGAGQ